MRDRPSQLASSGGQAAEARLTSGDGQDAEPGLAAPAPRRHESAAAVGPGAPDALSAPARGSLAPTGRDASPQARLGRASQLARRRPAQNLSALVLYGCLSLAMFGPWVLGRMSTWFLSDQPQDGSIFIWALRWWPYAISHHADPFFSTAVFAPQGINLAWVTTIPAPALALSPLTGSLGPFFSFNLLQLAAPALAAWTAFLLCRRISGSFAAALAGGFLFGFSPALMDEFGQGHPNLALVFLVPVAAYLVFRLLEGSMRPLWFVPLLGIVLAVQLYLGTEIFATMTLIGAICALIGLAASSAPRRERLRQAVLPTAAAYAVAAVLASPLLYAAFTHPHMTKAITFRTIGYGAHHADDFLRYLVPGRYTVLWGAFGSNWSGGNPWYLGAPLLALLIVIAVTERRRRSTWALAAGFAVILVLSLGSALRLFGAHILPWRLVTAIPVIKIAQPGRLFLYAYLLIAVLVTLWLARGPRRPLRWVLAAAAALMILPNFTGDVWAQKVPVPSFLASGAYRHYISPGEVVWVLDPHRDRQLVWQAQTGFSFRLAGEFFGGIPTGTRHALVQERLAFGEVNGVSQATLSSFIARHKVGAVLVAGEPPAIRREIGRAAGAAGVMLGGVELFRTGQRAG